MAETPRVDQNILLLSYRRVAGAKALARHGASVTCVLTPDDVTVAERSGFVQRSLVVRDPANAEDVVSAIVRAEDILDFSVVTTADEFPMVTTSLVARTLGLKSLSLPRTLALRDKFHQKQLIAEAGIRTANTRVAHDIRNPPFMAEQYPVIIKPFAEAGTHGTSLVRTKNELQEFANAALASDNPGPWLLEEYIEGDEFHIDGVVRDGQLVFFSLSRYLNNPLNIRNGGFNGSVVLDPLDYEDLYAEARDIAVRALRALDHRDGVCHLEVFRQENRFVFGECAGRVGGGRMAQVIRHKFGVDMHDEWARSVLGIPTGTGQRHRDDRSYGWMHLPAPPGRLDSVPDMRELEALPGVVGADAKLTVGQHVGDCSQSFSTRVASVQVVGATRDEVENRLKDAARWFEARVRTTAEKSGTAV